MPKVIHLLESEWKMIHKKEKWKDYKENTVLKGLISKARAQVLIPRVPPPCNTIMSIKKYSTE